MGVVTGPECGHSILPFTDVSTGCTSDGSLSPLSFPVSGRVNGPTELCIGYETQLYPSTGGVWSSTDLGIALMTTTMARLRVPRQSELFPYRN